jgi:hypothetical protein
VVLWFKTQNFGRDVFNGVKEFAVLGQKEWSVRSGEFNFDVDVALGSKSGDLMGESAVGLS